MKAWFKKLPLPVSGLMLGLASLGNLLGPYHMGTRSILGITAGVLLVLIAVKVLLFPSCLKEGFAHPVVASTMATFPMSVMLLSTYVKPALPVFAYIVWQLAFGLSALLIVLFTRTYVLRLSLKDVFPSWFVLFIGIAAASVTAPAYGMERLGQMVFWFGLPVYIALVPLVTYRVLKGGPLPEPVRPTLIIYAAPASLLVTAYLSSFPVKNEALLFPLAVWAFLMTAYSLVQMARLLVTLPFSPAFSAFTFPFVISATAFTRMAGYLTNAGYLSTWFAPIRAFMVLGATFLVLFVFFQYVWFMVAPGKASPSSLPDTAGEETVMVSSSLAPEGGISAASDGPAFATPPVPLEDRKKAPSAQEKAV